MLPQLKQLDRPVILAALALAAIGTAAIYSANLSSDVPELSTTWQKQVFYAVVAVAAAAAVVRAPGRALYGASYPLYLTALLLLLAVLAWGTGETATRWLALGPLRFQPSEVAKIGTIAALARYLADLPPWQCDRPRVFAYAALVVAAPVLLVAKQPDLGTALALGAPLLPMLYWSGMRPILIFCAVCPLLGAVCSFEPLWRGAAPYLFATFLVGSTAIIHVRLSRLWLTLSMVSANLVTGLATISVWDHLLRPYQRDRILIFLDPESDRLGAGWNIIQSKIAIGSGGLTGKGFLQGTQTKYDFLPAAHTDFVFSVIGEELGFLGTMVVLALFMVIIVRGLRAAATTSDRFLGLLAIGVVSMLLFHVFVNVGMTIGVMPVTGIPLPFLTAGGTSLLANALGIGLLLHVHLHRHDF